MGLSNIPSTEETEIPKVPHQDHVDNFFDSRGVVHKQFVPEGKTVNAEFYKGVMDRPLKRIQRVRPAAFCSRVFLLHDNAPAYKAATACQFLTPHTQTLQPLSLPYSPALCPPDYFPFPRLKIQLKGLHPADTDEIQEAGTAEIKGPKRGIFGSFSGIVRPRKSLYICQWSLF